ncbi:hypothetical protein PVAP13_3NG263201 [Panicum virgatum]|uniref:Uncharacterized protein n=1 Tax=Panicum virgatum TaxID=38727 RepID=A0A8T0UK80_PANVG|nr:hypothetical protein PVAP13_3NG263201 [Panicum virgatum]
MEDDRFDPLAHEDDYAGTQAWQSQTQHAGTSCGRGGFDLNSQASAAEGFPGLREYENFQQSSDVDLNPARGHPSMVPPPLHAPTMPTSTRHLNFGSFSAGAGGGVPYDRGAGSRQRTTTPPPPPPRHAARNVGGSQRGRRPHAARNVGRGSASGAGVLDENYEEQMEEDVEVLV